MGVAGGGEGGAQSLCGAGIRCSGAPEPEGRPRVAPSVQVKCTLPAAELRAQWAVMDPESGVDQMEWAVGTAAGAQDVMPYTATGHEGGYVLGARAAVALEAGRQYFVSVRATNMAGLGAEHPVEVPLSVVACADGPNCLSAARCL